MKRPVTERPDGAAPSAALRSTIVSARLKFIALGLSSLLLAQVANAQGSGSLAHHNRGSQPGSRYFATAVVSMTASDGSFLPGTEPGGAGLPMARVALDSSSAGLRIRPPPELALQVSAARLAPPGAVAPGYQTPDLLSVHFRHPTGDLFVALGAVSGGGKASDQLLATIGFRNLSLRVNSWRAVGRGPSVNARALALVRRVSLLRDGAEISLGGGVTMYRLGSRFDLSYRRHPISMQVLFRVRFGSHAGGQAASAGHSKGI
jgi:hypothetical protein